jgi:hypothetical protein
MRQSPVTPDDFTFTDEELSGIGTHKRCRWTDVTLAGDTRRKIHCFDHLFTFDAGPLWTAWREPVKSDALTRELRANGENKHGL